ncbi:MAG: Crp/Fnr family transcriptional regulator [Faecalibacterium sp.]|nr:Crp/Fnr family transcriptional regulator [Faecalibacterium sp.]
MHYFALSDTMLFHGTTEKEAEAMLACLGSYTKRYEKGELIYRCGETAEALGLVLSGSVLIESDDLWGNNSLLGRVKAGQIFAETYACIPGEPMLVNVSACEKTEILFLNTSRLFAACENACAYHSRLIQNLAQIFAQKNLGLSRRILHTSAKTIRGRLLSYLSEQAKITGHCQFTIPFNRQQLADYLSVDRSALSNELSKMQREGVISYHKNSFALKRGE